MLASSSVRIAGTNAPGGASAAPQLLRAAIRQAALQRLHHRLNALGTGGLSHRESVSRRLRAAPIYLETVSYEHFIRAVLIRTLPVACALALVLAGCEDPSSAKEPDPDTTPKFQGSVASQTYKELAPIEPLTLPRAHRR